MGSPRRTVLARRRRKSRRAKVKAALPVAAVLRAAGAKKGSKLPLVAAAKPSWKLLGLAGVAGVAATGVVVARNRRAQRDVEPDELRDRLHERLGAVGAEAPPPPPPP